MVVKEGEILLAQVGKRGRNKINETTAWWFEYGREERREKGKYGERRLLTNDYGIPLKEKYNIGFIFFCVVICVTPTLLSS